MYDHPQKVLLVDDEAKILEVVKAFLESKGFLVLTAENGNQVFQLLEHEKVSLILLDLMLPGISGEDICRMIRKKSRVPIIMLTATVSGNCAMIFADGDKINQVVINLLSNAMKYTNTNGKIEIKIGETDESVFFTIQDNGIGIPENELPFIFERFYRADKSRGRATGGSGIGLAIVRSIMEAHGGKVSVTSQLNHGSCFKVLFPKQD